MSGDGCQAFRTHDPQYLTCHCRILIVQNYDSTPIVDFLACMTTIVNYYWLSGLPLLHVPHFYMFPTFTLYLPDLQMDLVSYNMCPSSVVSSDYTCRLDCRLDVGLHIWVQIIYAMSHVTFYFFPMSPCHFL